MGKLILVPTPVGNIEDMTLRAITTLKSSDLILAEDTRTSSFLTRYFEIETPLQSHHKFNEHQMLPQLIERLKGKITIALITDAGTPGISDPGFLLVRECVKEGIEIECLPGPTAFIPALVVSGIPCDRFVFEGFLPQKKGRQKRMKELANETRTMVFYESPFRIVKTLTQFIDFFGENRYASVSREISKKFEETVRGTLSQLVAHFSENQPKGEFVIVVSGKEN